MNRNVYGIIGLTASIVLFSGDMLLYGHFGSASGFLDGAKTVASEASLGRLFAGGVLGPIGALIYIVGFWHIYLNTKQAGKTAALLVFIGCASMIVIGGTYHALWTVQMLLYKYSIPDMHAFELLTEAVHSYSSVIYAISAAAGYPAFFILFYLVVRGKSRYPRWTVIANPGILYILPVFLSGLSAPFGAVIIGGYMNLVFSVFFITSVITTWRDQLDQPS